jgi:hypothetical protein
VGEYAADDIFVYVCAYVRMYVFVCECVHVYDSVCVCVHMCLYVPCLPAEIRGDITMALRTI